MTSRNWNSDAIKQAAETSGKALEVECAATFLRSTPKFTPWRTDLSAYFLDGADGKARELDILVERQFSRDDVKSVSLQLLCSCKGLPPDQGAVTYSIPNPDFTDLEKAPFLLGTNLNLLGYSTEFGSQAGLTLLRILGIPLRRLIIGFDVLSKVSDQDRKSKKLDESILYMRKGDKDLYQDGIDSCIKAAMFWNKIHPPDIGNTRYAHLKIPVFILDEPWWDIPLDGGVVGNPVRQHSGFLTNLYPLGSNLKPLPLLILVWAASELEELAEALDQYWNSFVREIASLAKRV